MNWTIYTYPAAPTAVARALPTVFLCMIVACPLHAQQASNLQARRPSYDITSNGAVGDGKTKDTAAIQRAIDQASGSGGGTVLFPPGRYLSGSLHLRDNVTLHLDAGAVLVASPDDSDFDPYETLSYATGSDEETSYFHYAFIWGENISRVAIVGQGTIDANRIKRGGPKPLAFKRCRSVTIRDITILNSPNYTISPIGCDDINIDGVTILNGFCDGIDPDCCRNVRIANCRVETLDDAICLKSSFALGERRPTENVTVTNCILRTTCNAIKLGTESYGGFRYVTVANLAIIGPSESQPTTSGIAIETVDGAFLEGIAVSNITMAGVQSPLFIRLGNRGRYKHSTLSMSRKKGEGAEVCIEMGNRGGKGMEKPIPGMLKNVTISNVEATGATLACSVTGLEGHQVENVTLSNVRVHYRGGGKREWLAKPVPEQENEYPEATMFGEQLPAYGLYCRHARNLRLRDVDMTCDSKDERPAMVCDDVHELQVHGFTGSSTGITPYLCLNDVRRAMLGQCVAPPGTGLFLRISGPKTARIRVIANDLGEAAKAFEADGNAPADAVFQTANRLPVP